jgi:ribosomal protein L7/L12
MTIPPEVFKHILDGRKIMAIKVYREMMGRRTPDFNEPDSYYIDSRTGKKQGYYKMGLKEAKDKVDHWCSLLVNFKIRKEY